MFTQQEKVLLKYLIKNEIKKVEKQDSKIKPEELSFLGAEAKYDAFLIRLLKKL